MTANTIDMKSFKLPEGTPAETCPICREEDVMDGLEHRVSDTVAHRFHTECVTSWVQQQENCPTCRDKVTSINGVPIRENGSDHGTPADAQDLQLRQMRAFAISVHTSTAATDGRQEVLDSIEFVNAFVPVRLNADGAVATDFQVDERAAQEARIMLVNRLAQLDAEYAASMRGRVSSAVSSVATFVSNHKNALAVGGAATTLVAGAYSYSEDIAEVASELNELLGISRVGSLLGLI